MSLTHLFSDHCPIAVIFNLNVQKIERQIEFRDLSTSNIERFQSQIEQEFLICFPPSSNVNEYSYFFRIFFRFY